MRPSANQPVAFQLFSSSTRLGDELGEVVSLEPDEITVLPPIRTVLRFGKTNDARRLPVQLAVRLTEIGTLEVWCEAQHTDHRWQLQFDVRQNTEAPALATGETIDQGLIEGRAGRHPEDLRRGPAPEKPIRRSAYARRWKPS